MNERLFSAAKLYYLKTTLIGISIALLLMNSEQHFSNFLLIGTLLCLGYGLGKATCGIHFKDTGLIITLMVFVFMNILHSYIDGLSFNGQSFYYWLGAVGGHEAIRQPTLYVVLWALFQPANMKTYLKILLSLMAVTGAWLIGIELGILSESSLLHLGGLENWTGYSIFLFIGDIFHHLLDQYQILKQKQQL